MGQISTYRKINNLKFPYYRNKKEIAELSNQVKKLNEEKGIDRIRKVFDCSQVHGKGQEKGRRASQMHKIIWPEGFKATRRVQGNQKSSVSQKQVKHSFSEEAMSYKKERNQQHQTQKEIQ